MEIIYKNDFLKKVGAIPQTCGVFLLYDDEKPLFIKSSENLQKFVYLYCSGNEDKNVHELSQLVQSIEFVEHHSLIEAFIDEQVLIDKYTPEFNSRIKAWANYVYLGVHFEQTPHLKVCDNTIEDYYYIGPFRSSFVLNDVLDTFFDVFKMLKANLGEALPELLNRLIMVPNQEVVQKLNAQHSSLISQLEFAEAEPLSEQVSLLRRYYKNLLFTYTSQFINGEYTVNDYTLYIKDGMIVELVSKNVYIPLKKSDLSYRRNNELLAYDKSEYDHRWIVWHFLYQTQPKLIEDLFLENVVEVQKALFSENTTPCSSTGGEIMKYKE